MKILFIGGTKFVGRNIVEMALEKGHEVHLLNRGQTDKNLFLEATKYIGDRKEIESLIPEYETFDLVVDTCGYHPEVVEVSARYLKNKTNKYTFISTVSVYADFSKENINENDPVQHSEKVFDKNTPINGENYGLLKSRCENVVNKYFSDEQRLILRPCIIVGKYDNTHRFNFWVENIKTLKTIEIPNDPMAFIQYIDVRAISEFVLNSQNISGVYNLVGPKEPLLFFDFINDVKNILNSNVEFNFVNPKTLKVPLFVSDPNWKGFFKIDGLKAYSIGLPSYSCEETICYTSKELKLLD